MKEYNYTNDLGYHKKLIIGELKDGKYPVTLWSNDTGDFCGTGNMTPQQLTDFLIHYHFTAN